MRVLRTLLFLHADGIRKERMRASTSIRKKAKQVISGHVYGLLVKVCDGLLEDAERSKEFRGFTGNTQTSYSCGLYVDGNLSYYVSQDMWTKWPVRKKIPKGVTVYLKHPYEGRPRSVTGRVDVDGLYGKDSSFQFLKSFKEAPEKGFAIVMTTGTEYSVYIETVHDLNVLTDTWQNARHILLSNMKPIP